MNLRPVFGLDLRSLALFRVLLGTVLLADLLARLSGLRVVNRGTVIDGTVQTVSPWHFQLSILNDSGFLGTTLMGLAAVFAVLLIFGWRTRTAAFVSWILLVSLNWQNGLVLTAGDRLLLLLLFWGWLLPLGARWSLDLRLRVRTRDDSSLYCSPATAGLSIQLFLLLFSFALYQAGQALNFQPGLLPAAVLAGLAALLPPRFWKQVSDIRKRIRERKLRINSRIAPEILYAPPPSHELPTRAFIRAERCRHVFAGFALCLMLAANINDHFGVLDQSDRSGVVDQSNAYLGLQRSFAFKQDWTSFSSTLYAETGIPQTGPPRENQPESAALPDH